VELHAFEHHVDSVALPLFFSFRDRCGHGNVSVGDADFAVMVGFCDVAGAFAD